MRGEEGHELGAGGQGLADVGGLLGDVIVDGAGASCGRAQVDVHVLVGARDVLRVNAGAGHHLCYGAWFQLCFEFQKGPLSQGMAKTPL